MEAWGLTAPCPMIFRLPLPRGNRTHVLGVAGWPQKIVPRAGCPRRLTADTVDPSHHPSIDPSLLSRPNDGLGRRSPQILSTAPRAGARPPGSRGLTSVSAGWQRAGASLQPDKLQSSGTSSRAVPQPERPFTRINSISQGRQPGRSPAGAPNQPETPSRTSKQREEPAKASRPRPGNLASFGGYCWGYEPQIPSEDPRNEPRHQGSETTERSNLSRRILAGPTNGRLGARRCLAPQADCPAGAGAEHVPCAFTAIMSDVRMGLSGPGIGA